MQIEYCDRWFWRLRKAINPIRPDVASARHTHRKPYVAVIGGFSAPKAIVYLSGEDVVVSFVDKSGRDYLEYEFGGQAPSELALRQIVHRQYADNTDEIETATVFIFSGNGGLLIEEHDIKAATICRRKSNASVADQREDYPVFGNYKRLLRKERGTVPSDRKGEGRRKRDRSN